MDLTLHGDEGLKVIMTKSDLFISGRVDDEVLSVITRIRDEYAEFYKKVAGIVKGSAIP